MRILWVSNFSSQSGYANQARLFVPRLRALGHTVIVFELANGSGLPRMTPDGTQIVPTHLDPLGNDMIREYVQRLHIDAVITLCDVWAFQPAIWKDLPWFPWTPIDHQPVPPQVAESLKACLRPIAMSRFGLDQLRRGGFDPLYIPLAVDPTVWQPGDKCAARHVAHFPPDLFLASFVGVNDSNPSRKGIPELLAAWSMFSPKHPDARLYLHTSDTGNLPVNGATGGVRIDLIVQSFGIDPQTILRADQYRYKTGIPASEMATLARASDVLVQPSRGEGFGLPLLEFQRVGTPVITTDFAAGAELCFSGWKISGEPEWSWQNATVMKPGIADLVDALELAYAQRDDPTRREQAIRCASDYDVDIVLARDWLPALDAMAAHVLESVKVA